MKKSDKTVLSEGLRKLSTLAAEIADQLDGVTDTPSKKAEEPAPVSVVEEPKKATVTKEDVRAILADKSRSGFRAEVKALLTEFRAEKLSDITDPDTLAALAEKAMVIGSA